nr:MAG TPA: hypothetical protein [Caudoviricetes sp.]
MPTPLVIATRTRVIVLLWLLKSLYHLVNTIKMENSGPHWAFYYT